MGVQVHPLMKEKTSDTYQGSILRVVLASLRPCSFLMLRQQATRSKDHAQHDDVVVTFFYCFIMSPN